MAEICQSSCPPEGALRRAIHHPQAQPWASEVMQNRLAAHSLKLLVTQRRLLKFKVILIFLIYFKFIFIL
jgi:hypothetical protein